ncbi:uncharacterized protein LOC109706052 isoform X2 [Ananas comosus]|uniref:Uncharacterized protein LOC109706052 isoform X2 n=1 Tax=Ananas comosus TaxID=4615 RepID=A0A6P5EM41_ANACO|nr:uncharacterized protein LOC109706052 isoform X2 [Ananas comosus]
MDPKALTRHLRRVEPLSAIVVVLLLLLVLVLAALLLFLFSPNSITSIHITSVEEREKPIAIWKAPRQVEWRPCEWWCNNEASSRLFMQFLPCCSSPNKEQWLHQNRLLWRPQSDET